MSNIVEFKGIRIPKQGEPYVVKLQAEIKNNAQIGRYVQVLNGVTGYERFSIFGVKSLLDGWCACNGNGDWDALFIPGEEMEHLTKSLGIYPGQR